MFKTLIAAGLLCISLNASAQTLPISNPFYEESSLPFHAPDFTKIKSTDFQPAMIEGMRIQLEEIQKIADNPAKPTLENTLVAMEKSGRLLDRASNVFSLLTSANTDPELQKARQELAPLLAAHGDAILLNGKLFNRIRTLYINLKKGGLPVPQKPSEENRLIENYYQRFLLAGAKLSESQKDSIKRINEELASLSAAFTNKLLAATKSGALVIYNESELAGLSIGDLNAAARDASAKKLMNKWLIPLQNTTQQPLMRTLTNRDTRQKLFEASYYRTEKEDANDTRSTISRMAKLRAQKAKILGFPNFASWKLQDQMAKKPANVQMFLAQLVPGAVTKSKQEAKEIQALIDKQGGGFKLQPWDWNFYSEQVRKQKYDLDEKEVKPYFELDNVLQKGVFYAANLIYGLTFTERHDIPVYQSDVRVFEVHDADNSVLGLFYCDYYKRDNKTGGAWNSRLLGSAKIFGTKSVIYNVCNFTKPAPGQPALITYEDARTMFHEFGHALHGFFSDLKYPSLGANARDFVEFPSQFNEHWALDQKVLKHYAINNVTGEPIPQVLVDKIKKAETFNQGYILTEALTASALDMQWHTLSADAPLQDVDQFESEALKKTGLNLPQVPPRYRSSYFSHIWASGYASGYYGYQWTEMLDDDAYAWFEEHGGMTRANGDRFRKLILSQGNKMDYDKMYRAFRGKDPSIKAMQRQRGIMGQ